MKMKIQQATLKIQSIDRLHKKNGMTMKIDAREYLTKSNTHPWLKKKKKTLRKPRIEGNFLDLIKNIYKKNLKKNK